MNKIKRRFLEILRAIILIVGIALTVLPNFIDITAIIKDPGKTLGIGLSCFIIAVLWYLYDLQRKYLWTEPEVVVSAEVVDRYDSNNFYKLAQLKIINNEELEIRNCYATLVSADDIYGQEMKSMPVIPSLAAKRDRIKWEDLQTSDANCEITIPPNDERRVNVAIKLNGFHFLLCNKNIQTNWMLGSRLHVVQIRVDGYFNGKAMKPLFFNGYIYEANYLDATETSVKKFGKDKLKKPHDNVGDQIQHIEMVFKEGDWKKDKQITNKL